MWCMVTTVDRCGAWVQLLIDVGYGYNCCTLESAKDVRCDNEKYCHVYCFYYNRQMVATT